MRDSLQSFADGELTATRRTAVARHLERCPRCAASVRRLRESDRLFGAVRPEPEALAPEVSQAILARALAEAGVRRRAFRPSPTPFSWAFAAGLLVTAGAASAWWSLATVPSRTSRGETTLAGQPPRNNVANTLWSTTSITDGATTVGNATKATESRSKGPQTGKGGDDAKKKDAPGVKPPADPPRSEQRPRRAAPSRDRLLCRHPGAGADAAGARERPVRPASPARPAGVELVSGPVPGAFPLPEVSSSDEPDAAEPAGQLLVMVTPEPAASAVTVTLASEEKPSFARASALRPDESGKWTWVQSTIARECSGPEQSLVLLGGDAWQWDEEQIDEQVWGQAGSADEGGGDAAPGTDAGGEPAGEEIDGAEPAG